MQENDQHALTGAVVKELGINRFVLWMHFVSLGGNAELESVLMNLAGVGSLQEWGRDVLSAAANDLTLQPPGRPGRRDPTRIEPMMTLGCGEGGDFSNPPPQPHFSRHCRIRLLGFRHRCPRCFGDGSWAALPSIRSRRSRPPRFTACWASSTATTRPDLYRSSVRSRRFVVATRACQMRSPVVVLNVRYPRVTGHFAAVLRESTDRGNAEIMI